MKDNMSFASLTDCELEAVSGGEGGGRFSGIVEGGRKILQAGAVAFNTLFPGHQPIKPPPTPAKIERVAPRPAGQVGGSRPGGAE